jgi:hypothetical protein
MAKKKSNKKKPGAAISPAAGESDCIMVDPARVRFQHARIRPFFSGCGRRVEDTLEEIRQGKMKPSDLPPIQVLVGPVDQATGEPWYFSLNNRRLWVLKRCREEGLLQNNEIFVRVRKPKSEQESLRYSIENCVLEAKFMPEKTRENASENKEDNREPTRLTNAVAAIKGSSTVDGLSPKMDKEPLLNDEESKEAFLAFITASSGDDSDTDGSEEQTGPSNRFSALF